MTLDDVSDITLGERCEHYREAYGVYKLPIYERAEPARVADKMAETEMLQEIHTMLLHLTKEARL